MRVPKNAATHAPLCNTLSYNKLSPKSVKSALKVTTRIVTTCEFGFSMALESKQYQKTLMKSLYYYS